jgi:16S rRNA (uracil1498-N3)-methyltransferase
MPHFFVPPRNVQGGRFFLAPDESRHLAVVLRKKPGEEVLLFDGEGKAFRALLESVSAEKVSGKVLSEERPPAVPFRLRLFQGFPKGEKFDWILEKMTELGAAEIVPVYTERAVARVPKEKLDARLKRWEKIVLASAKQCGRAEIPKVRPPRKWAEALGELGPGFTLLPWEGEEKTSLRNAVRTFARSEAAPVVNLLIGPEGGLTPEEVELAVKRGAVTVTLGPAILRTETAGLFVASALLYEWS